MSFSLQKFWTFADRSVEGMKVQLTSYFLVALGNLTLNTASMYVLVDHFQIHYLLAQIATMAVLAMVSYVVYQRFIFTRTAIL